MINRDFIVIFLNNYFNCQISYYHSINSYYSSPMWLSFLNFVIVLKQVIYFHLMMQYFDCNWARTQNHLVLRRKLNHLAKLHQHYFVIIIMSTHCNCEWLIFHYIISCHCFTEPQTNCLGKAISFFFPLKTNFISRFPNVRAKRSIQQYNCMWTFSS